MTHDLSPSASNAADIDASNRTAEVARTAVSSLPGDAAAAKPTASRRFSKAPHTDSPPRTIPTDTMKASQPVRATGRAETSKAELVLKKLRLARGVTVAQIMESTGWQAHSVRGFLSAVVRKKLGLNLSSEVGKDGVRRYRVVNGNSGQVDASKAG